MSMIEIIDLSAKPDMGYLKFLHDRTSQLVGLVWTDISFHPLEEWLKIWYDETLTAEQETALRAIVVTCQIDRKFKVQSGEEYYEHKAGNKRGSKHRGRVKFRSLFSSQPTLEIFNAEFNGLANMEIVKTDVDGFNFLIEANGSKKGESITTMQFEWRAWLA